MSRKSDRPKVFFLGVALLGAATGLRSQLGVATVTAVAPPRSLPSLLRRPIVRKLTTGVATLELVGDKMPSAPDRTQPGGLITRIVLGGSAGGVVARTMGFGGRRSVVVGAIAATASTFAGLSLRRRLISRFGPLPAGLIEDGIAVSAALVGVRLARS
jgi:uncharacterized membrane protein